MRVGSLEVTERDTMKERRTTTVYVTLGKKGDPTIHCKALYLLVG